MRREEGYSVRRDVPDACRSFRRTPLLALTIMTTVALGLVTAGAGGALIPALRAGRIDPGAALRQD